jgi:bacillithiol synthase
MENKTIKRRDTQRFSAFSTAFSEDQSGFSSFLGRPFSTIEDLTAQAKDKSAAYPAENREILVSVLEEQSGGSLSESQRTNLDLLKNDTTFTITTGHQLTLFGGPMFMLYKVMHVVKLAEAFNTSQNEYRAVPVFWMASEDHDIDEIRSANLFNKTLTWNTEQEGAAGRLSHNGYSETLDELKAFFANHPDAEMLKVLEELPQESYGRWYREFISRLFADYGVLVIEPDNARLKRLFLPVIQREIAERPSLPAVEKANAALEAQGLKPQAYARACNLFLLDQTGRHRIDPGASGYLIAGEVYTTEKLLALSGESPESFSPNVILRPVYQETVLPNLAYVGGGGEMAYWVQLKGVFDAHRTLFPLLQQRNSLMLIDGGTAKRIEKTGWETERFFQPKEQLRNAFLKENDSEKLDLSEIRQLMAGLHDKLVEKAKSIDASLESFAEAESVRMEKQLDNYEQKLIKQVKQQHDQSLKNIDAVTDRLFPGNGLQERWFHWLQFAPDGNISPLFRAIYEATDPFEGGLIIAQLKN